MTETEIKKVVELLSQDLTEANYDFAEYKDLFWKAEDLEILNKSSAEFFARLKRIYFERLVIYINRMTDPFMQKSFRNISIFSLKEYADNNNWNCKGLVTARISEVKDITRNFVIARNKFLCHRSMDDLINQGSVDIQVDDIEIILKTIEKCIDLARRELNLNDMVYHYYNREGAKRLKLVLELGIEKRNQMFDEMEKQLKS